MLSEPYWTFESDVPTCVSLSTWLSPITIAMPSSKAKDQECSQNCHCDSPQYNETQKAAHQKRTTAQWWWPPIKNEPCPWWLSFQRSMRALPPLQKQSCFCCHHWPHLSLSVWHCWQQPFSFSTQISWMGSYRNKWCWPYKHPPTHFTRMVPFLFTHWWMLSHLWTPHLWIPLWHVFTCWIEVFEFHLKE